MSHPHLQEQAIRPMPIARILPPADRDRVLALIREWRERPGPLLPILHGVQEALRHVPAAAIALIAEELNLSRAEVHGVVSFYHYFRTETPGRQLLQLCRAEACQAQGAVALEQHVKRRLGVEYHQTTADGRYTLEPVYCLGNCACGPSLMLDQAVHGRVSAERFDALLKETA
jgi:formate dehydrogenase subunit gamma